MTEVKVLVVFYSRRGETEKLALAAGVGAIQARASIRLRRLADLADAETIASDPEWTRQRERMSRDYVAPREVDAEWANVVILAAPDESFSEMKRYLDSMQGMNAKIAAPLLTDGSVLEAAARAGFTIVAMPDTPDSPDAPAKPPNRIDAARIHGRHVAEIARKLES